MVAAVTGALSKSPKSVYLLLFPPPHFIENHLSRWMYCDMVLEQKGDPNEPNEVFQDSWGTRAQGAPGISLRSGH